MPLTDPTLVVQYRKLLRQGYCSGRSIVPFVQDIAELVRATRAKTLLDYGCGQGEQYLVDGVQRAWGGTVPTLYDPAWPAHDTLPPGAFDGVICTDVLEHLPESDVQDVLAELHRRAMRFLFLSVCCRKASKKLPDGRDPHQTIKPEEWWREAVGRHARKGLQVRLRFSP